MQYQLESNVVSSGAMKITLWPFSLCIFISVLLFLVDLIFFILNRVIQIVYDEQPLQFKGKIWREDDPRRTETKEIDGVELENTEGGNA